MFFWGAHRSNPHTAAGRGGPFPVNRSAGPPGPPASDGPRVAAPLFLGTFLLSSGLILSVAASFYLKRSRRALGAIHGGDKALAPRPSDGVSKPTRPVSLVAGGPWRFSWPLSLSRGRRDSPAAALSSEAPLRKT
ncbi:uncharacterized protein C1orf159 homolog [Tamandua tetradactyla]|uniref:uncharacterized protein C1orf159 homolog n=1 Tax=Tamandua tetradactyla TaxID=48850 RepID=UPI0040546B8D